jgi:hypothetical protein
MSSVYNGDDERLVAGVTIPSDGDAPDAASVNTAFEALTDAVRYAESRTLTWQMANDAFIWTRLPKISLVTPMTNAGWAAEESTIQVGWYETTADPTSLSFEILPPHAMAALRGVYVVLAGAGHAGAVGHVNLPGTMPTIAVWQNLGGFPAAVAITDDGSPDVATYDAAHIVYVATPALAANTFGTRLVLRITGETGANSLADHLALFEACAIFESVDAP